MTETARTSSGDLVFPRVLVTDFASCILQQVKDGLALFQLEWFLDQNAGFPWVFLLGVKIVSTQQIETSLQQFLLSIPGIVSVTASSSFNRAARQFSYDYWAQLNNGQILTGGSATPPQISGAPDASQNG